jgi:hypothetical protein
MRPRLMNLVPQPNTGAHGVPRYASSMLASSKAIRQADNAPVLPKLTRGKNGSYLRLAALSGSISAEPFVRSVPPPLR